MQLHTAPHSVQNATKTQLAPIGSECDENLLDISNMAQKSKLRIKKYIAMDDQLCIKYFCEFCLPTSAMSSDVSGTIVSTNFALLEHTRSLLNTRTFEH